MYAALESLNNEQPKSHYGQTIDEELQNIDIEQRIIAKKKKNE